MKISILLVEDHILVRHFFRQTLNIDPRFKVIGETGSGDSAVSLAKSLRPDVVLMDINLTGMNGLEATKLIHKNDPRSRVLCISGHNSSFYIRKMLQNGALGYLTKNAGRQELYSAIEKVYSGKSFLCDEAKKGLEPLVGKTTGHIESLSKREKEIVELIQRGKTSKEIATELTLSCNTVEVHRYRILKKLNLKNSAALVNMITVN